MEISSNNNNEIVNWKEFSQTPMWKYVCSILKKRIEEAEYIIFAVGADKQVEFTKRDIAVIKRDAYLELMNMPENNINALDSTGQAPIEEMDAYSSPGEEDEEKEIPELISGVNIDFIDEIKKVDEDFQSL